MTDIPWKIYLLLSAGDDTAIMKKERRDLDLNSVVLDWRVQDPFYLGDR